MNKEKVGIAYRIAHFFTHHPWLKIVSLILAAIVWFYVRGEMGQVKFAPPLAGFI